jgi:hypothetical protein
MHSFLPYNSLEEIWKFISAKRAAVLGALFDRFGVVLPFEIIVQLVFLLAFFSGMLSLILKKRTGIIILTCTPPLLHVFLSAFQIYPFELRLFLYILPGVMIICSIGFVFILRLVSSWLNAGKYTAGKYRFFILLFPILLFLSGYPVKIKKNEIKESIRYIQANRGEDEKIYAYSHAAVTSQYYVAIGFAPPIEYIGQTIGEDEFLNRLKKLHGKHWVLYTSLSWGNSPDDKYTVEKLDSCYKRLKTFKTTGSSAYLYDFGE